MKSKNFPLLFLIALLCSFCSVSLGQAQSSNTETVRGKVCEQSYFEDGCPADVPGIEGVMVSNQREVVLTDENGYYELPIKEEMVVFVSKPADYEYAVDDQNIPVFYYIHQPEGSPEFLEFAGLEPTGPLPESVDFALVPSGIQTEFTAIVFGDPQPRDHTELSYYRDAIVPELATVDADMTMVLGDIMFDDLSLFGRYNQIMSTVGMPVFNIVGNHDLNFDADQLDRDPNRFARETYKSYYGPTYYSFAHGDVHFIVMDNMEYQGRSEETGRAQYVGYLDEKHLAWIENTLTHVPEDKLIVLMSHIPLYGMEHDRGNINTLNREELFALLEGYDDVLYLGGHRHLTYQHFLGEEFGRHNPNPIHHVAATAACGSWWSGPVDKTGVPVSTQQDGVPKGYHLFHFNGSSYSELYKAAGKPWDYQMRIESPGGGITREELGETDLMVNVFNGSERSEVRYRVNEGDWVEMERQEIAYSPFFTELYADYQQNATPTNHIWSAPLPDLPEGSHRITAWTRDMYGQEFTQTKVVEVYEGHAPDEIGGAER
ncbi:MAG: calcineurin-like phosphoesterase family protein [Balneolaceae bacterium]|nr:calcineurin-like phosphoesterase family protein [Balneolaceae bacterium]